VRFWVYLYCDPEVETELACVLVSVTLAV